MGRPGLSLDGPRISCSSGSDVMVDAFVSVAVEEEEVVVEVTERLILWFKPPAKWRLEENIVSFAAAEAGAAAVRFSPDTIARSDISGSNVCLCQRGRKE